ncbi:FAD-dependent monooxygenase [Paenibacillus sp. MZ04-78.2]|uniref:FAD-dependent monooxygenase n=1 Tax=Paenibacillus sp. MZ04-78.2 TaxID=2962034 RepID=UPI0020B6F8CE|nr:FAD-dependent monooxygenase [Paenibacillus sp. MZ04-78.2]MCP3775150.1 FAD-dependent monooxygenase [Paenibacillus sp. MZ04-78.2]
MVHRVMEKDVCIAGGGPAGLILGMLLAKAGVDVVVLESHDNFDREYRGEVLQPRFLQLLEQVNLRSYIESFPSSKLRKGALYYKDRRLGEFSFDNISEEIPYALWMPQPILLQALYDKAKSLPSFELLFHAAVKELRYEGERVTGAIAQTPEGTLEVRARVTVGADGRFSAVSRLGGFEMEYEHLAGDLVWFTVPKPADWGDELRMKITDGYSYILLPKYPNCLQVGVAVPSGEWKAIRQDGIEPFRQELLAAHPAFREFAEALTDFKPFVLLQVKDFYVKQWAKDGCLLIGDAAHCASPVGAVGVSLSVTTAVIAADVIYDAFHDGDVSADRLGRVQALRDGEIRSVHKMQARAARMFFASTPFLRTLAPVVISLVTRTKLLAAVQRRVLSLSGKVPIHERFTFQD